MVIRLFNTLKDSGFDVYFPAKKPGKCTSPYIVVKEEKAEVGITGKSLCTHFSVIVVTPVDNYNSLSETISQVKGALKNSPFKFLSSETDEVNDDDGYVGTMTYQAIKKMNC